MMRTSHTRLDPIATVTLKETKQALRPVKLGVYCMALRTPLASDPYRDTCTPPIMGPLKVDLAIPAPKFGFCITFVGISAPIWCWFCEQRARGPAANWEETMNIATKLCGIGALALVFGLTTAPMAFGET